MERLFGQVKMLHSEICPSIFYYCYWMVKTQSSVKSRGRKNECLGWLTEFLLQKFAWGLTIKLFLKKLYSPFLWMGFNCLKATEPLRGGSLLFTIKFPVLICSTLKGWIPDLTLEPPSCFEHGTPGLGIQCLNH